MIIPPLYHYSNRTIRLVRQKQYYNRDVPDGSYIAGFAKPIGFWVSVKNSWKEWCEKEGFHVDQLKRRSRIYLKEEHNLLVINNLKDFDKFCEKYKRTTELDDYVNWYYVKKDYKGILIFPYFWERRLSDTSMWYYGWDCASGCIWDVSCIESVKPLGKMRKNCKR